MHSGRRKLLQRACLTAVHLFYKAFDVSAGEYMQLYGDLTVNGMADHDVLYFSAAVYHGLHFIADLRGSMSGGDYPLLARMLIEEVSLIR